MEYLTIQEPRSTHYRGMEHHQPAYYGSQTSDGYARQPRLSGDARGSPSSHAIDPSLSSISGKTTRWLSSNASGYYQQSTSPEQSISALPLSSRPVPRSMASILQGEQSESAPRLKRMSGDEWNGTPQQVPARSTATPTQDSPSKDDRPTLPSFNALVADIQRTPEPQGPPRPNTHTDPSWKRQEPTSFPPMEPHAFQFGGRGSSAHGGISNSSAHHMVSSEPTSPHAYSSSTGSAPHPMSPRSRMRSPPFRGHARRASDYRNRAFPHISAPPQSHEIQPPSSYPSSHHRTHTFPSYPAVPINGYKNEPYQQQHLQQQSGEYGQLPPVPGAMLRHPPLAPAPPGHPAGHPLGHSRNDSVMTSTEESRFYSATTTFHANPSGPTRKRRGNLPKDATRVLRQWFDEHLDAPYPGEEVKNQLCMRTGLQMSQVNNWFINARRRLPRQDRSRKDRESTDVSESSPPRAVMKPGHQEYWG